MTLRRITPWLLLGLLAAAVGHWSFWYRPRERTAVPATESLAGAAFAGGELPYRAWVPFPHQNLSVLERALGDPHRLIGSIAEMTGRPMPELPGFGAARLPPATEMLVATDVSGERFLAIARVYPIAGILARWAGRLAGNPLLSGGAAELDGRRVEVDWIEGNWVVRSPGVDLPRVASPETRAGDAALVFIALDVPRGRLPAGEFALRREGSSMVVEGGDSAALAVLRRLEARSAPLPLLTLQTGTVDGSFAARCLGLLPGVRSVAGLPGAVTAWKGPRRWHLPGEKVLDLIGDGPPRSRVGEWKLVALEESSLERGEAMVEFARSLEGQPPLSAAVWVDISAARRLAEQVAEALEAVPVVGRREARRWRAVSDVMAPLQRFDRLTALLSPEPAALIARLGPAGGKN